MTSTDKIKRAVVTCGTSPGMGAWATIRWCFALGCLTLVLYSNANDFDITEYKSIVMMATVYGIFDFGPLFFRKKKKENDEP